MQGDDPVERALREWLGEIEHMATVGWSIRFDGVSSVNVVPKRVDACPFSVGWSSHEVVIGFGIESQKELGPGADDLELLCEMIRSIVVGQIVEAVGTFGTKFCIQLQGGRVLEGGTHRIFTPQARRRRVQYSGY